MLNLIVVLQLFFHPFHVSVCEINLDAENKRMEITQKIFLDDLEVALNQHFDAKYEIDELIEEKQLESLLKTYISGNFSVQADGKPVPVAFLGIEADVESVWCYLEAKTTKKKTNLIEVNSTVLTKAFDDQINLIHLTTNNDIQSEKLGSDETIGTFEIED